MLITPPTAPLPYNALSAPRTISIWSTLESGMVDRSTDPTMLEFTGIPSTRTSTCSDVEPRMLTVFIPPVVPLSLTTTPAVPLMTPETSCAPEEAIWSWVMSVTELGDSRMPVSTRVAVTTTSLSSGGSVQAGRHAQSAARTRTGVRIRNSRLPLQLLAFLPHGKERGSRPGRNGESGYRKYSTPSLSARSSGLENRLLASGSLSWQRLLALSKGNGWNAVMRRLFPCCRNPRSQWRDRCGFTPHSVFLQTGSSWGQ